MGKATMKLNTKDFETKMTKAISAYEQNLATVRAGQANPNVLSRVAFDYYGAPTLLSTMADIRVADAKTLVIKPYDQSTLKAMEKAILMSDVGLTPANDGQVLRLSFPVLTEDRRKELKKQVQKMGEEAKVAIRNIRRDAMDLAKKMKKDGEMTEDEQKTSEKSVQDLTDKYIKSIDAVTASKEKEIMTI
jgi:ribosome recycling factor